MKVRNLYPWLPFVAASLAVAALAASRWLTPHPAPPPERVPARYADLPPWAKPDYPALRLHDAAPELRVIHPAGYAYCYVVAPGADPGGAGCGSRNGGLRRLLAERGTVPGGLGRHAPGRGGPAGRAAQLHGRRLPAVRRRGAVRAHAHPAAEAVHFGP